MVVWTDGLVGIFIGFVLLPVIYNAGLYHAMREPFLLWHSVRAVAIAVMTIAAMPAAFGIAASAEALLPLQGAGLTVAVGVSGVFLLAYVGPGMIGRRTALLLRASLWTTLGLFLIGLVFGDGFQLPTIKLVNYLAILVLLTIGLVQALKRGSRAARFQTLAWSGVFAVCAFSIFQGLVLRAPVTNWISLILVGLSLEIVVTAVGVADRFMTLKRERDEARASGRALSTMAATDPLTGLSNRRGFEDRFTNARGSETMAVAIADIDHFKAVNDTYGHDVGDAVIVAASKALARDGRFAARLGGEEFAIILTGDDIEAEAEFARRTLAAEIAIRVPVVGKAVTASMGLSRLMPDDDLPAVLKRADEALYRAKKAGRDRLVVDRERSDEERLDDREKIAA
ncbi:MAG: diguanylate cyclase [Pacificimonas sp.]